MVLSRTSAVVALLASGLVAARAAAADPTVSVVRVSDGGICPRAVVDGGGTLHVVYFKGESHHGDLFHARSTDGGRTFAAADRVNDRPNSVVVAGSVRGPQLAVGRSGRLHVTWTGRGRTADDPLAMNYARSADAGGFEPARDATADHPGIDGGGSVAADGDGRVYLAWHAPAPGGETEADRRVWLARSADDGATFGPVAAVGPADAGCCGCCGLQVAAAVDGRVAVVYRTAAGAVHRDITVLTSADYGATFAVAATDPWEANVCVMSTASVALTAGRSVAAWETRGAVCVADLRRPAAAAVRPPRQATGSKHPSVAVNAAGQSVVAWAERTGRDRVGSVAWQAYDADGRPVAGQSGRADGLPPVDVPAVVALPDGTFRVVY